MMYLRHSYTLGLFIPALLLPSSMTQAALVVSEGFDYAAGSPIFGSGGGTGWASNWSDYAGGEYVTAGAAGLTYGALPTSGGSAVSTLHDPGPGFTWLTRSVPTSAAPTLYVSYLLRRDLAGASSYGGLGLLGSVDSVFVGKSGTTATLGLEGNSSIYSSSTTLVTGDVYFLLTSIEFGVAGGKDRISTYINPPVDGTVPASADVVRSDLDLESLQYIYLNNSGGWTTDEIRVGTTWASAIPEPVAYAWIFGALALLVPVGRRLRRN